MQSIRIFISSPGDVASERARAREVIDSLRRRYAKDFFLKPVFWEDLPLQPDMSFQEGIDVVLSEKGADIAVFILWSRLGSPLGTAIRREDGSPYRSGTEREFDMMMRARACSRERGKEIRPSILVYTRQDESSFEEALRGKATGEKKELINQKELVESFIREAFMDEESGTSIGAYFPFDRPTTFTQRLRTHLQELLDRRVDEGGGAIWDTSTKGPPFPGLKSYQAEHADVFHGREEEVLETRRAIRKQAEGGCAFLLLSGSSGSGKSSLARAGILPAIVTGEIDEEVAGWKTLVFSPSDLGEDPTGGFVKLLAGVLPGLHGGAEALSDLGAALRSNAAMAYDLRVKVAITEESPKGGGSFRILLLVDQLEEIFSAPAWTAETRREFLDMLEVFARSGAVWVLATVRSDFYPQLQSEPALIRMKGSGGLLDVLPAGADALSRLIKEPARLAGLAFEERDGFSLADRILKDAARHSEVLPLISFVLRELYEKRTDGKLLTYDSYEELGGVDGALAGRAEKTFTALPDSRKRALDSMLHKLVTLGNNVSGETLMRRTAEMDSFTEEELGLVEQFVAARLFTTGGGNNGTSPFVTVAHESLLRVWGRATDWADRNRDFLRVRDRIDARMREGSPLLAGDPLLATAEAHLATRAEGFSQSQREWIAEQAGNAAAGKRKSAMRRRIVFSVLAVLTVCAVAVGLLAMKNRELAKVKAAEAEREKTRNAAFHLLHRAAELRKSGRLPEALGLLAEAYSTFPDFSTRSALLDGLVAVSPELETTVRGFGDGVGKLAFGKDGRLLAAGSTGGIWRLAVDGTSSTVAPIDEAGASRSRLLAVEVTAKGWSGWLESGGHQVIPSTDGKRAENAAQGSAGGWVLAACASGRVAWVEGASQHQVLVSGTGGTSKVDMKERISALAMDAEGRVAVGLESGSVFLLEDGLEPVPLDGEASATIASLAWSRTGELRLLAGYADGGMRLFFPGRDSTEQAQPPRLPCRPVAIEWSPVDDSVAVAGDDGLLRILRPDVEGYRVETHVLHLGAVLALAWSEDGKRIATGGQDGSVAVWRPGARLGPIARRRFLEPVTSLSVSPDGKSIAAGTSGGSVHMWRKDGGRPVRSGIPGGAVWSLAWNPDGKNLAAGSGDDRVFLLRPGKPKPVAVFGDAASEVPDQAPVSRVRWSKDGGSVASSHHSGQVRVHERETGESRVIGKLPDLALGLDWSSADGRIAAASTRGEIFIWENPSGEPERFDNGKGHARSVGGLAWSPGGKLLASGSNDGTIRLWDASGATGSPDVSVTVDSNLEEVVFSGSGDFLATAGSDGFVRVWKAEGLEPFLAFQAHGSYAGAVVWLGGRLVSASMDSTVVTLDLEESRWLARARRVAGSDISLH